MTRTRIRAAIAAVCVLPLGLVNCAAAPMGVADMPALTPAIAEPEQDARFATGLNVFRTGEAEDAGWIWDAEEFADWALFGVTLSNGRDKDQVWFVRLSIAEGQEPTNERFTIRAGLGPLKRGDRITSPASRVRIESYDQNGNLINSSHRTVPVGGSQEDANAGLEALGRALAEGANDTEAAEELAKLSISMQEIGRAGALRPIRTEARKSVINEPSMLTLILNAFRINVRADFENAEALAEPWVRPPGVADVQQYVASSPLFIAGQHVLNCQVVMGPMGGPFALTAGLLGFEITHPDRPQNKLTVRMLATKPQTTEVAAAR